MGTRVVYGSRFNDPDTWDADKLQSCHCGGYPDFNKTSPEGDKGYWEGPHCSLRTCPYGNDVRIGVPLRYQLACTATGGSATLSFSGNTATKSLAFDGDADALTIAIMSIPDVESVIVSLKGSSICSSAGSISEVWMYTNIDETLVTPLAVSSNALILAGGSAGSGSLSVVDKEGVIGVENQTITCTADGGSFTIKFRGQVTTEISFDANSLAVKRALESLASIGLADVTTEGTTVCSASGAGKQARRLQAPLLAAIVSISANNCFVPLKVYGQLFLYLAATVISFKTQLGDIPLLEVNGASLSLSAGTPTIEVNETDKGTTINIECSGRGRCG